MDAKVKRLWLKALRSGKYEQTRGRLSSDGAFCCLGVLCELHSKATGSKWSKWGVYKGMASYLPKAVQDWAGLNVSDPSLGHKLTASDLNDTGKSFNFIAKRIERYL